MKTTILLALLAFLAPRASAAPAPRLTGLLQAGNTRLALLEYIQDGRTLTPILKVGERVDPFELLAIDSTNETVSLRDWSANKDLDLQVDETPPLPNRTLHLHQARLDHVLELYQTLAGLTVVRPNALTASRLDLASEASLSGAQAAVLIEAAMTGQQLIAEHRGNYLFVIPNTQIDVLLAVPQPTEVELGPGIAKPEVFPPGLIKFQESDVMQVLDFYQELSGRTLITAPGLLAKISVRSETQMTQGEAVWLLDSVLRLNGVVMAAEGKKFTFAVPTRRAGVLKAMPHCPRPAIDAADANQEMFPAGLVKFQDVDLNQILDFYGELSGRTILRTAYLPDTKVTVKNQAPTSRDEVVWLLESALRLRDIVASPAGPGFSFVLPIGLTNRVAVYDGTALKSKARSTAAPAPLRLQEAPLTDVLNLYAEATGRQAMAIPAGVPALRFSVRSTKPLSPADRVFALDALAALYQVRFDLVGEDQVKVAMNEAAP